MTVSGNRHSLKRGCEPLHGLFIFRSDLRVSAFRSQETRFDQCLKGFRVGGFGCFWNGSVWSPVYGGQRVLVCRSILNRRSLDSLHVRPQESAEALRVEANTAPHSTHVRPARACRRRSLDSRARLSRRQRREHVNGGRPRRRG